MEGTTQDFFVNLAADFFGVAILFFLINRFFGLNSENTLIKRTETLISLLEQKYKVLNNSKEAREKFPLEQLMQSCQQLDLMGYDLTGLLDNIRGKLVDRVQQGMKVRVLVIDPQSLAREVIYQNSTLHRYDKDIILTFDHVRFIQDRLSNSQSRIKGSFEFRAN